MRETTLKEIANSLGISTTVSKALKNYPDVSDKTKKLSLPLIIRQTVLQ
jgi:LacI family transcriptional regulator